MKNPHLFCFGLGYCAQHLVTKLRAQGWRISGTHRSVVLEQDSNQDIKLYEFDSLLTLPKDTSHILISIPPRGNTDIVINRFAQQINELKQLKWVGYLSATSVYGDNQGRWVDEKAYSLDFTGLARPRIMAEQQWLNLWHNHNVPVHIFRLSGIYGPGRSEVEKALAKQSRIISKPGHVFCRIHVADVANALHASITKPTPGEIFNVADDLPTSHADVVSHTCHLLQIPTPNPEDYDSAVMSDMLRHFYGKCSRVDNKKIKEMLGITWQYPTYREGLDAICQLHKEVLPKP